MHSIRIKLILLLGRKMPVALNLRIKGVIELASAGLVQNVTVD